MSMKTSNSPRRLYTRNGYSVVLFDGRTFAPSADSDIRLDREVTCAPMPSDGGKARVEVTQRVPGKKAVVEAWRAVTVPVNHRG